MTRAPAGPRASSDPLPPPAWLPADAVIVWGEVEPLLRGRGVLRREHAEILATWCVTSAELRQLAGVIARHGSVATGPHGRHPSAEHSAAARLRNVQLAVGRALGLDPLSAARVDTGAADDTDDELEAFLRRHPEPIPVKTIATSGGM